MSAVALLYVNMLVALFDPDHVHHEPAHRWFEVQRPSGWATSPLTDNGLVRVASNPGYAPRAERPAQIVWRLRAFCGSGEHRFWPDLLSIRDLQQFSPTLPIASRQLTDVYLLALAKHHGGRLATFDRSIPWRAVSGTSADDLELLSA